MFSTKSETKNFSRLCIFKLIATALQLMWKKALQLFLSMLVWTFLTVCYLSHSVFYAIFLFLFLLDVVEFCFLYFSFSIFFLYFTPIKPLVSRVWVDILQFEFSLFSCFFILHFHLISLLFLVMIIFFSFQLHVYSILF